MVCIHYIHFLIVFIALCIVFTVSATYRTLDLLYLDNVSRHSTLLFFVGLFTRLQWTTEGSDFVASAGLWLSLVSVPFVT